MRLLQLQPGSFEDEIRVGLSTVSLQESPTDEALSYVWGTQAVTRFVTVCGNTFQVTVNLEVALRRLRLTDQPRTLWIDALCINQQDMAERSAQVKMMGAIYSQSSKTLLWLGEEDEETEFAMCVL